MDELRSVSDGFTFRCPVWIVNRQGVSPPQKLILSTPDGSPCVPVFTDEDLAWRFIETLGGRSQAEAERIPNQGDFERLLVMWQVAGVKEIAFDVDPASDTTRASIGIGALLQRLKG